MHENEQFTLLIVDDDQEIRNALKRFFIRLPYRLLFAEDGSSALDKVSNNVIDLMVLDLKMPGMDGLTVLKSVREIKPDIKIIMLTGHGGIMEAVEAMKMGAEDFFEKSISPEVLRKKVEQIYSLWCLTRENNQLREQIQPKFRYAGLIGESPPMLKLKDAIVRIAPTDISILIQGESGTGKELVAKAIHMHSARNSGVFMPVDCAAINETVMESEMFGHARGAFTGADKATLGLIRSADKGTLFLDEVGELSLSMQAKLLRTIQEKTVRPVGSTSLVPVDIRIVAATNRDLVNAVAEGRFRQDLYYRLSAVTLRAPALRERGDDVVRISRFFAKFLQNEGLPDKSFSEKAIQTLMAYPWPGNVRELENTIRSALAFATGDTIDSTDLSIISEALSESSDAFQDFGTSLSDYELDAIRKALKQSAGNRRDAARVLGISESTLYRRIKQYNL